MAVRTRQVKNKRDGKRATYGKGGFLPRKKPLPHEAKLKTKLQAPTFTATVKAQSKQTVKEYLDEWVESYARVNLRPATYDGYKRTIHSYIVLYIGHVALNQLSPFMIDKAFQEMLDKSLKPGTVARAKRVAGTEWEMPVMLDGLYGMRRFEILGPRWQNVDLKNSWLC